MEPLVCGVIHQLPIATSEPLLKFVKKCLSTHNPQRRTSKNINLTKHWSNQHSQACVEPSLARN